MCLCLSCLIIVTISNKMTERRACDVIRVKGEVKAKIKISPVVVFGVLSRMVLVRGS